jgi:DNA-directed DNA polymerase III PolC
MSLIVSAHTMPESYLTASTLQSLLEKATELKREYFVCSDIGYLHASYKSYTACKKAKLKPILGVQLYFKDPLCPIIGGTAADRCRYFMFTAYAENQEAFQALCGLTSRTDFQTIQVREEKQNLLAWKDLEYLSQYKINIVLGGTHCLVGKSFLASDANVGLKLFEKINTIFPSRLRIAVIAEPWQKKYAQVVEIKYLDQTKDSVMASDMITTDRARRIKASDLVDRHGHAEILSKVCSGVYSQVGKKIDSVKLHSGFLPLPFDVTHKINKFLIALATRYSTPVIVSDYAYYANKEDRIVQDIVLERKDRIHSHLHMKTEEEITTYLQQTMGLNEDSVKKIIQNNTEWASLFDTFELKYTWQLADVGTEEPIKQIMTRIKKNGRMQWDNPQYVSRLQEELAVIYKNGKMDMSAYFLPICDILDYCKEKGYLTGPGRGSSAGSLLVYLLGITQVNPFRHNLSFSRFYSMDRINRNALADIDSDLESRLPLVGEDGKSGYLFERWGNKCAQISTRTTIRLKSAIKDVNRYFNNGKVSKDIEALTEGLPPGPQGIPDQKFVFGYEDDDGNAHPGLVDQSEDLQKYIQNHPKEWEVVQKSLGLVRSMSRHASAFIISNKPVSETVPTKDGNITQPEAKSVEDQGLVKYDLLVIHQLADIRLCMDLINKKNNEKHEVGYFSHNGQKTYIWDLPEDQEAFKSIWDGNTETCFQINTKSMIPYVKDILPKSIDDLSVILSIVRPGPLDFIIEETGRNMAQEYVHRRNGGSYQDIAILEKLIPETYSTLVYQEQITKIAKEVGGFSGQEAEILRENIGKKKAVELSKQRPKFIEGACKLMNKEDAEQLWDRIETFGRYSFNLSHATSYSYITFACIFLKHFYPLEWWAAILGNASESEISGKFWPHVKGLIAPPDINISTDQMEVDYANKKIRSKLGVIRGMGDKTIDPIVNARPYKDISDFVNKEVSGPALAHKLIHVNILDSLFKPNMSLEEKLKAYEDAVEVKKFQDKKAKAQLEGKKIRLAQPKEGSIPEAYLNLHPLKDAAMKKAVLPTIPIDLFTLGSKYSKVKDPQSNSPKCWDDVWDKSVFLVDGPVVERLDKTPGSQVEKDIYVACTAYVIDSKEFSYSKGAKRALKLTVDCGGGNISEKVLWPDFNTGELIYDANIGKGSIVTLFLRKRADKDSEMNITRIIWEA